MGAVNQLYRFIPILAELCAPVRPLLSNEMTWEWTEEEEKPFQEIKKTKQSKIEIIHFKKNQLMQTAVKDWHSTSAEDR